MNARRAACVALDAELMGRGGVGDDPRRDLPSPAEGVAPENTGFAVVDAYIVERSELEVTAFDQKPSSSRTEKSSCRIEREVREPIAQGERSGGLGEHGESLYEPLPVCNMA